MLIPPFFLIVFGIDTCNNDVNVDLSKARFVIGQVTDAGIRRISSGSARGVTSRMLFYFRLNASDQNFGIYNSYEGYDDLRASINIGDTIKVYFGQNPGDEYNQHVFQVEKNGKILVDYYAYNNTASENAGVLLLAGMIGMIVIAVWIGKFDIIGLLNGLVKP